jgi:NodT family efflux transporter outer membrane factor (OMF) lipoprotein
MIKMKRTSLLLLGTLLSGCAVGPDYHKPDLPAPDTFAAADPAAAQPSVDPAQWWKTLGDQELDSLVERAIAANPDLAIALDRLQEARTEEAVLLGDALPQGGFTGGAANGTGSDVTRGRVPSVMTSASNTATLPTKQIKQIGGFDGVWELDLFGQYRRALEAGIYTAQAAAEARNQVLVSVISDVVRAYVDLRGLQMRLAVLNQDIDAATQSRDYVKMRFEHGLTNELDLTLAERELSTLAAQRAPLTAQTNAARYTIATLIGRYPEDLAAELADVKPIPAMPAHIEPGLPLQLIERRPDIRQSEAQLAAANARIGVAIGNLFPHIGLAGSVGAQFDQTGFNPAGGSHIWSLGPAAYWSLLDFGALDAEVDIADYRTKEQLETYRRSILTAVRDVDSSVEAFSAQQDSVANLSNALAQAQRAVTLATERYNRGLTDFLNVVDAERRLYDLEAQLISAQQGAGDDFVALFRSLGGGWEGFQDTPDIRLPHPAVVAMIERLITPVHDTSVK